MYEARLQDAGHTHTGTQRRTHTSVVVCLDVVVAHRRSTRPRFGGSSPSKRVKHVHAPSCSFRALSSSFELLRAPSCSVELLRAAPSSSVELLSSSFVLLSSSFVLLLRGLPVLLSSYELVPEARRSDPKTEERTRRPTIGPEDRRSARSFALLRARSPKNLTARSSWK